MPSNLTFSLSTIGGNISTAVLSLGVPVAKAAKLTMLDAGAILKTKARAHISDAGLGKKLPNAYRVNVYPKGSTVSIDSAAIGRMIGIKFTDIFQTGGTINGSPLLWLPLPTTPKIDRRKNHAQPKDFINAGIKLIKFQGSSKPLLGANVSMSPSNARKPIVTVTLANLKAGTKGKSKRSKNNFVTRLVPLFFGVPAVTLKKRLTLERIAATVQEQIPDLYNKYINTLADK